MAPSEKPWADLEEAVRARNNELVVKRAAAIEDDADGIAARARLVALVNTKNWDEVHKLAGDDPDNAFLRAYVYYRQGKFPEAQKALKKSADPTSEDVMLLQAQVMYRMAEYSKARKLYEKFMKNSDEVSADLLNNLTATFASNEDGGEVLRAHFGGTGSATVVPEDTMWELTFNVACASVDAHEYDAALRLLDEAEEGCRAMLAEDGADDEEVASEVAIIHAQRAYVHQLQHKKEEAERGYKAVQKANPTDKTVGAVAANNLIALRKDRELFRSDKDAARLSTSELADKLTKRQRDIVAFNRALLQLYMAKKDQFDQQMQKLGPEEKVLLSATRLYREKHVEECLAVLRDGVSNPRVALAYAQVLALSKTKKHLLDAIDVLRNLDGVQYRLGTVATILALADAAAEPQLGDDSLKEALAYWQKVKGAEAEETRKQLHQAGAQWNMAREQHGRAIEHLEAIYKDGGEKDKEILAQLVLAYSMSTAPNAAKQAASKARALPALKPLTNEELDKLEDAKPVAVAKLATAQVKSTGKDKKKKPAKDGAKEEAEEGTAEDDKVSKKKKEEADAAAAAAAAEAKKIKKKKKRKPRYPKDYDPENPKPYDPSHWLPLKERYRKKSTRTGGNKGAHQGAVATDAKQLARLDAANRGIEKQETVATSHGQQQKKKKKKGGRR